MLVACADSEHRAPGQGDEAACAPSRQELVLSGASTLPYPFEAIPVALAATDRRTAYVLSQERGAVIRLTVGGRPDTVALPVVVEGVVSDGSRLFAASGNTIVTMEPDSREVQQHSVPKGIQEISRLLVSGDTVWATHTEDSRLSQLVITSDGMYEAGRTVPLEGKRLIRRAESGEILLTQAHTPFSTTVLNAETLMIEAEISPGPLTNLVPENAADTTMITVSTVVLDCGVLLQTLADVSSLRRWFAVMDVPNGELVRFREASPRIGLVDRVAGSELILAFIEVAGQREIGMYRWTWETMR